MTTVTELALSSLPNYSYRASLNGNSFIFEYTLNERQQAYHLKIMDVNGNPLVSGLRLLPNTVIGNVLDLSDKGFIGYLWMLPKTLTPEFDQIPPSEIGNYYRLFHVISS